MEEKTGGGERTDMTATTSTELHDGGRDIERAVGELGERLPAPLWPLARLAYNYRWSWLPGGADLFRDIDASHWRHSDYNPRAVIEAAKPRRLQQLSRDIDYTTRLRTISASLEEALLRPPLADVPADRPIAYYCSEFAVHCSLPIYGGGLGVLAGDLLKAASDMALPMVGIGLLYREGYFHQRLDTSGWQHEYWVATDFDRGPAVLVTGANNEPLVVEVGLRGRTVRVQIWRVDVGRVPLYLLDTDREDNHPIDRWITSRLYVGDRHTRLTQYGVLGIGGARALAAMGIQPRLTHLNEGHAAFGSLERVQQVRSNGQTFDVALNRVRDETIFTTHTPVAAGNEGYSWQEIEPVFADFADSLGVPRHTFYGYGRVNPANDHEAISITPLALRTSRAANAVSQKHGEVAREMWRVLWPERSSEAVPIGHVTNGVHTETWMAGPMQLLLDQYLGARWRAHLSDPQMWKAVDAIPDADLWRVRCQLRQQLVEYAREESVRDRIGRGEPYDYVDAAARVFQPEALTVGFARRVATYKRLYLIAGMPDEGLMHLLGNDQHPVQLVLAGKAHPSDDEAKTTLRNGFNRKANPLVGRRVVFLEDYDLHMAPRIVAGVDLWLNLPRPPLEASGTSGMKVVLNGGLNLSVLDGWWLEGYDGSNGWAIDTPLAAEPHVQDEHDARKLMECLNEVVPLFYDRDANGIPRGWLQKVRASMRTLIPKFTAERMLRDYVQQMYVRPR